MRVASRKSISDLADAIEVPERVVSRLENGCVFSDRNVLLALAAHYGVSLETLIGS